METVDRMEKEQRPNPSMAAQTLSSDWLRTASSGEVIRSVRRAMAGSGVGLDQQLDQQREHFVAVLADEAEGQLGGEQPVVAVDVVAHP